MNMTLSGSCWHGKFADNQMDRPSCYWLIRQSQMTHGDQKCQKCIHIYLITYATFSVNCRLMTISLATTHTNHHSATVFWPANRPTRSRTTRRGPQSTAWPPPWPIRSYWALVNRARLWNCKERSYKNATVNKIINRKSSLFLFNMIALCVASSSPVCR